MQQRITTSKMDKSIPALLSFRVSLTRLFAVLVQCKDTHKLRSPQGN